MSTLSIDVSYAQSETKEIPWDFELPKDEVEAPQTIVLPEEFRRRADDAMQKTLTTGTERGMCIRWRPDQKQLFVSSLKEGDTASIGLSECKNGIFHTHPSLIEDGEHTTSPMFSPADIDSFLDDPGEKLSIVRHETGYALVMRTEDSWNMVGYTDRSSHSSHSICQIVLANAGHRTPGETCMAMFFYRGGFAFYIGGTDGRLSRVDFNQDEWAYPDNVKITSKLDKRYNTISPIFKWSPDGTTPPVIIAAVQAALRHSGNYKGRISGRYDTDTRNAIKEYLSGYRVPPFDTSEAELDTKYGRMVLRGAIQSSAVKIVRTLISNKKDNVIIRNKRQVSTEATEMTVIESIPELNNSDLGRHIISTGKFDDKKTGDTVEYVLAEGETYERLVIRPSGPEWLRIKSVSGQREVVEVEEGGEGWIGSLSDNNKSHGRGTLYQGDAVIVGQFNEGVLDGDGRITYRSGENKGAVIEGHWRNGICQSATYHFPDGRKVNAVSSNEFMCSKVIR